MLCSVLCSVHKRHRLFRVWEQSEDKGHEGAPLRLHRGESLCMNVCVGGVSYSMHDLRVQELCAGKVSTYGVLCSPEVRASGVVGEPEREGAPSNSVDLGEPRCCLYPSQS